MPVRSLCRSAAAAAALLSLDCCTVLLHFLYTCCHPCLISTRLSACPQPTGVLGNTDAQGVSVIDALEHAGFDPSPDSLRTAAVPKEKVRQVGVGGWAGGCSW